MLKVTRIREKKIHSFLIVVRISSKRKENTLITSTKKKETQMTKYEYLSLILMACPIIQDFVCYYLK